MGGGSIVACGGRSMNFHLYIIDIDFTAHNAPGRRKRGTAMAKPRVKMAPRGSTHPVCVCVENGLVVGVGQCN